MAMFELSFGGGAIGNLFAAVADADASNALDAARRGGIRSVDTAPFYGHGLSEVRIGAYLQDRSAETFDVTTKVGRSLEPVADGEPPDYGFANPLRNRPVFDYSRSGVERQVDESLGRLGVGTLEGLLLHDIGKRTHGAAHDRILRQALDEALPAINARKAAGAVSRTGIGVNESEVCETILDHADIDVMLVAGRYTLLDQSAAATFDRALARGVSVHAAGVFNSGLLVSGDRYDYAPAPAAMIARRNAVADVCERHGVALGAAALHFAGSHPAVERVVVGLRSPTEVEQLLAWRLTPIPPQLWAELAHEGLLASSAALPC